MELSTQEAIARHSPNTQAATSATSTAAAAVQAAGTAALASSWQTSNMQYGKFYVYDNGSSGSHTSTERQIYYREGEGRDQRADQGRCAVLTKTLIDCRNQLGHMRLRNTTPTLPPQLSLDEGSFVDPPTTSYYGVHVQRLKSARSGTPQGVIKPSTPSSRYSSGEEEKPRESCSREGQLNNVNVSATHAPLQERCNYNNARTKDTIDTSGIEEDTKQLEWILKRLVEKLQPLTNENEPEGVTPNTDTTPASRVSKQGNQKENQRARGKKGGENRPVKTDQLEGHHKLAPYYKSGPYYKYLSGRENRAPETKIHQQP